MIRAGYIYPIKRPPRGDLKEILGGVFRIVCDTGMLGRPAMHRTRHRFTTGATPNGENQ